MALARLGSDRVAIIKKGSLEIPSDLEGIIRLNTSCEGAKSPKDYVQAFQ